ncbi:MAG: TRAP transporter large permease subunit [Halomonas sp.]|uniref:TRAP transporter large permease subunit n=1 Tax=Halomonas sp. TaxID=1486246 RepID=UPI003F8D973E
MPAIHAPGKRLGLWCWRPSPAGLEISFSTPPLGLLLFVMKGVAPPGTTMSEIYSAAIPYILCSMLLVALLVVFPSLATGLPSMLQ